MKKGFFYLLGFVALGTTVLLPETVEAQCSMCRAVTNSNQLSDDAFTIGNGLNNAIVYLMFTPYVMAAFFFYAFYRKQITAWFKSKFSS
ncbi:MAG: hypothetical protein ACPGU4_00515 [Flavobacteriales bacterium]